MPWCGAISDVADTALIAAASSVDSLVDGLHPEGTNVRDAISGDWPLSCGDWLATRASRRRRLAEALHQLVD